MAGSVPATDRVAAVDALRGFALLGILLVNIWYFADSTTLSGGPLPATASAPNLAVRFLVTTLFEGKFYLLFSLLFGYGSAVLRDRAGGQAVHLTSRRLGFLAVLGILHGATLFYGDILLTYALAGSLLLATRSLAPRVELLLAVAITAAMALLLVSSALLTGPAEAAATAVGDSAVEDPAVGPAGALAANAATYGVIGINVVVFQGPLALAAFYAGSALAAWGVLRPSAPPKPLLRRLVLLTLPAGLVLSAGQAWLALRGDDGSTLLASGISVLVSPLVTIGYAAGFLLLLGTRPGRVVSRVLAPMGRLSLSNYVAQSALLGLVFTGYGLGLQDRLPAVVVVLVGVAVYLVQAVASRLLLRRFASGPLEWALRRVTYGRSARHDGA
ncbi:DUF418 domain-containing protein [uncultured Arthrobacter sp.]|uniref:DUF418 domain-containing protein n=1 Tax=uncultured Arthrobacter sp. TaxID=114050 RepID=UPI0026089CC0|nr:DUF418 domain-containing protein [uncultured Arthrobacter sp.]